MINKFDIWQVVSYIHEVKILFDSYYYILGMKLLLQALLLTSASVSITTANDADLVAGDSEPSTPRNQGVQVQTPDAPIKKRTVYTPIVARKLFDDSDSDA